MALEFSFSDKEREFFNRYQDLFLKYSSDPEKFKLFLELEADRFGIENPDETVKKFEEFLRSYLFFKSRREELKKILPVKDEILKLLEQYPDFVPYEVRTIYPDREVKYASLKWREPLLLAAGEDGLVRVFRAEGDRFILVKEIGKEGVGAPLFELDGSVLYYAAGNELIAYNAQSGKPIASVKLANPPVALEKEGESVVLYKTVGGVTIRQEVGLERGKIVFGDAQPAADAPRSEDFVAVGKKLIKLKEGELIVMEGGREQKASVAASLTVEFGAPINDLLFLEQGLLVSPSNANPALLDPGSGERITEIEVPVNHTYKSAKNPAREEVALSHNENLITVWDPKTWRPLRVVESYFIDVMAIDYSPDGRFLAAAGEGRDVNVWETENWSMVKDIDLPADGVMTVRFSPDGRFLAAGSGDFKVYLIDTQSWEPVKSFEGHEYLISDVLFLNAETMVTASWDGKVILWSVESGEKIKEILSTDTRVWRLALSPGGDLLAAGDWGGRVTVFNTSDWSVVKTIEGESPVMALAFGGEHLAVGRKDGTIQIVPAKELTGESAVPKVGAKLSERALGIAAFGGNLLTYGERGALRVWDAEGRSVFSARVKGELAQVRGARQPKVALEILEDAFLLRGEGTFYGGGRWKDYLVAVKGTEIVEDKEEFLKEVTDPGLVNAL